MANFKIYLFNGPIMQNLGKFLSLPADTGSNQRDLTSPLPHIWSDHSQAHQGTGPSHPAPVLTPNTSYYTAAMKSNAFWLTLGSFQKNKIKNVSQTLYRSGIKVIHSPLWQRVFKTWIKLFYARPKTPFPPPRAFTFPGTQSGSCKQLLPQSPMLGPLELREHWGFHCWVLSTGAAAIPALPATAKLQQRKPAGTSKI